MIHYHGTPLTPINALYQLAGRAFCVSFASPQDVKRCHDIGQSVMLDNGAYSEWRKRIAGGFAGEPVWVGYYAFADQWLAYPTTWAVIPDIIDGGENKQDDLIAQWPHGDRGAPVWHMDENSDRLLQLCDRWPRVCIGSTSAYSVVGSPTWERRADHAFNEIARRHRRLPWIHLLRGMSVAGKRWPFASVDSTDIARNHNRAQNSPGKMAARWDAMQSPAIWQPRHATSQLFDEVAA